MLLFGDDMNYISAIDLQGYYSDGNRSIVRTKIIGMFAGRNLYR